MATASVHEAAKAVARAFETGQPLRVFGATGAIRSACIAGGLGGAGAPVVVVAVDDSQVRAIAADVAFFAGITPPQEGEIDQEILVIPEVDVSPYADLSPDPRSVAVRLAALGRLCGTQRPQVVVASVRSLVRRVLPRTAFERVSCTWTRGQEVRRTKAIDTVVKAGYRRVDLVEDPGTFAVRGGVMDIYVSGKRFPMRLEWFGDDVERIRFFDPGTQRSLGDVKDCVVWPVRETITTATEAIRDRVLSFADEVNAPSSKTIKVLEDLELGRDFFGIEAIAPALHDSMDPVWSYLPDALWVAEEPEALIALATRYEEELEREYARAVTNRSLVAGPHDFMVSPTEFAARVRASPVILHRTDVESEQDNRSTVWVAADLSARLVLDLSTARARKGGEILRPVIEYIRTRTTNESDGAPWTIMLAAPNKTHAQRLTSLLRGHGLHVADPQDFAQGPIEICSQATGPTTTRVVAGEVSTGFESKTDRFLLLSEADIFGRITRRNSKRRTATGLGSLTQLQVGDYIVHVVHGIGRYDGLTKLTIRGVPGDFVRIEYAGQDRLYLPVYRLGEIERYLSAQAGTPKLDKMGGSTFSVRSAKVKADVRQVAEELLQIYAQREAVEGVAYPDGGSDYAAFESTFPFEETPDQQAAIDAVQADLGRSHPMDRLVCGDVGFGKTEVALRATYRVAMAGKQVAILAPTTVLVQQHFLTFRERMESFGIRVACLNRLASPKERKQTVASIREGTVDVIIGTHRLLGRDIRFHDLGLAIIDEEQRFGVAQKERFKRLRSHVDVLTMTATPIPRTLHMSLLGIREISLVMTPPMDRLAIRTFLTRPSDVVLEEGIRKELARGGQVFYVVPKIQGIEEHAIRIRQLVPEARVSVAHGRMPADLLSQTMIDFVEHRCDVLVSTTIIESGLDIPRANTMFIARADRFGLSQLYQLRGRIGRSKYRAYCYLMVDSLERLAPDARQRLEALVRFAELGSGYNVAAQDLEIRGAGEILGGRQSGQVQAVGFEAYSRLLAEAVAELRGRPITTESDPEISIDIASFLPDDYVEDAGQRLDVYRRLSTAGDVDDVDAIVDELQDRFGDLPEEAIALTQAMTCKTYARQLRAASVELRGPRLAVRLTDQTPLSPQQVLDLQESSDGRIRLRNGEQVVIRLTDAETSTSRLRAALNALQALTGMIATSSRAQVH